MQELFPFCKDFAFKICFFSPKCLGRLLLPLGGAETASSALQMLSLQNQQQNKIAGKSIEGIRHFNK